MSMADALEYLTKTSQSPFARMVAANYLRDQLLAVARQKEHAMATAKKGKVRRLVYEYDPETEKDKVTVEFVGVFGTFTEEEYDLINTQGTGGQPLFALRKYINGSTFTWTQPPAKPAPKLEDLRIEDMSEKDIDAFLKAL